MRARRSARRCPRAGAGRDTVGAAGVFGFYPNKQMTTGEGGVVVTRDPGRRGSAPESSGIQGRDDNATWLRHVAPRVQLPSRRDERRPAGAGPTAPARPAAGRTRTGGGRLRRTARRPRQPRAAEPGGDDDEDGLVRLCRPGSPRTSTCTRRLWRRLPPRACPRDRISRRFTCNRTTASGSATGRATSRRPRRSPALPSPCRFHGQMTGDEVDIVASAVERALSRSSSSTSSVATAGER